MISPDRTPKIRRGQKAKRKSARVGLRAPPQVLPTFSRKPLPEADSCPKKSCKKEACYEHCQKPAATSGSNAFKHEVDVRWLGWAKGYGDGTFDVSCKNCGEVGWVHVVPESGEVAWG